MASSALKMKTALERFFFFGRERVRIFWESTPTNSFSKSLFIYFIPTVILTEQ